MQSSDSVKPPIPRLRSLLLFCVAGAWFMLGSSVATRAARGISGRFGLNATQILLGGLFELFLVVLGLRAIDWLFLRDASSETVTSLPKRATSREEWGVGAAIGWGLALATVVPLMLSANLHVSWTGGGRAWTYLAFGVAGLLVVSLVEEMVLRGYLLKRLQRVIGATLATLILSLAYGFTVVQNSPISGGGLWAVIGCTLLAMLLSIGYLRTRAIWLSWGLHFAYRGVVAIFFGLPVLAQTDFQSVVTGEASGRPWLTGGYIGLDATLLTMLLIVVAMVVLFRATRDFAWHYTYEPIVPGGYEVTVAPPSAHVEMERKAAAAPPPLVQILTPPPPPPIPPAMRADE